MQNIHKNTVYGFLHRFDHWTAHPTRAAARIKELEGKLAEMGSELMEVKSRNFDLITAAKKITVTAHCNTTIGLPGTLSCRLQPNHPTDDPDGIIASVLEGLSFGAGDAVIGLNPAGDTAESVKRILTRFEEVKNRHQIPTQTCVLAHVTTQMRAI